MLLATTADEQTALAVSLDRHNKERRRLERAALEELVLLVGNNHCRGVVIYGPRWKKGIAGILASRAVERYGVPAFVLVLDERTGMAVGSGRSIDGVSLIDALRTAKTLLHRFGGHKQAAGVTLRVENIPPFREAFEEFLLHCKHGPAIQPDPDADLDLTSVTRLFNEQLRSFGPFGIGNPVPVFRVQDASIRSGNPGFIFVKQRGREIKARGEHPGIGNGTALLALSGTSASLAGFIPCK